MKNGILLIVALFTLNSQAGFMEEHPQLNKYLYKEPRPDIYLGFGFSPLSLMKNRVYLGINAFQVHWYDSNWDMEIFSVSYGITTGQNSTAASNHFTFRTVPKYRLFEKMSVGLLLGYEFVSFPGVDSYLFKAPFNTKTEPFSGQGAVYGLAFSETFDYKEEYKLKLNQLIYMQTYSVEKSPEGWDYFFLDPEIQSNKEVIEPVMVFLLEFSILF